MKDCAIVEDLYPLYEEGLVQDQTAAFVEEHLHICEKCREKFGSGQKNIAPIIEKPKISAALAMKKTQSKLAMIQLVITLLSFYLAMSTNLFSESFGFILTYFILGIVIFSFYQSWMLTFIIAFFPVLFIAFADTAFEPNAYRTYMADHMNGNIVFFAWMHLIGAVMIAILHTFFAMLGGAVAFLWKKTKKEGAN